MFNFGWFGIEFLIFFLLEYGFCDFLCVCFFLIINRLFEILDLFEFEDESFYDIEVDFYVVIV